MLNVTYGSITYIRDVGLHYIFRIYSRYDSHGAYTGSTSITLLQQHGYTCLV